VELKIQSTKLSLIIN